MVEAIWLQKFSYFFFIKTIFFPLGLKWKRVPEELKQYFEGGRGVQFAKCPLFVYLVKMHFDANTFVVLKIVNLSLIQAQSPIRWKQSRHSAPFTGNYWKVQASRLPLWQRRNASPQQSKPHRASRGNKEIHIYICWKATGAHHHAVSIRGRAGTYLILLAVASFQSYLYKICLHNLRKKVFLLFPHMNNAYQFLLFCVKIQHHFRLNVKNISGNIILWNLRPLAKAYKKYMNSGLWIIWNLN